MDVEDILPTHIFAHLAEGLQEGEPLDVAHGATHLGDHHLCARLPGYPYDAFLYLIGDMGYHLDGST